MKIVVKIGGAAVESPAERRGVQTTTSVLRWYAAARAASVWSHCVGGSGHGSPSRARSLFGSSTIEDTPRSAHSSTSRRISTVFPDPDPAKIAACRRSAASPTSTGCPSWTE